MSRQFTFLDTIDLDNFRDVQVSPVENKDPEDHDPFWVCYASGRLHDIMSEDEACTIQRAWRLAHGRHPLTAEPILTLLQQLTGLADEAVTSRETDPDEDDTEEMSSAHRQTVNDGNALCEALKEH